MTLEPVCSSVTDQPGHRSTTGRLVAEHARLLQTDGQPTRDYAITEVVHCKSKKEGGVQSALRECADRYLLRVLQHSPARLLVVLGRPARLAFRTLFNYPDDVRLSEPMEVAGRVRRVAFVSGPSAVRPKISKQLPAAELQMARDWLVGMNENT
jgi:hypothetical protein